jgi:hypothetical protein
LVLGSPTLNAPESGVRSRSVRAVSFSLPGKPAIVLLWMDVHWVICADYVH